MKQVLKLAALTALFSGVVAAQTKEVTIGYQDMTVPLRVAQEAKEFEKATGYKINWKQFGGGADVIKAMASGAVQIGELGSAPLASAVSRGEPYELFWIIDDIGDAEALVAKNGTNINSLADLKGKRVAMPFGSTAHFHMLVALDDAKINPSEVKLTSLRPPEIRAAWERGDLDATYIWDPVLADAKKNGKVVITSGQITAKTGKATFDGYAVNKNWSKDNRAFIVSMIKVMSAADSHYRANKGKYVEGSAEVNAIAKWSGAKPADVPSGMALYGFPSIEEQVTAKWLGGGKDGVAVKALAATAAFKLSQKEIDAVLPDYSGAVNASYAMEAMKK
jgi:taurine transport system substrate-binding protein